MEILEKAGRRFAVMDSLTSPKTGLPLEVKIHSPEQEISMRAAGRLGEHLADRLMQTFSKSTNQPDTCGETRRI
jgi:hypothetical protein